MSNIKEQLLIILFLPLLTMFSCGKEEGYGGNSAIVGKLKAHYTTPDYVSVLDSSVLMDDYVYIMFNEGPGYGDRVRTDFNGRFEFTGLSKGSYKVYAFGEDKNANSSESNPVVVEVLIDRNRSVTDIGDLVVKNNTLDGIAEVSGKVKIIRTNGDEYYGLDEKVILIHHDSDSLEVSERTNLNGVYSFKNLHVGSYSVYAYSKDVNDEYPGVEYPVIHEFTIDVYNDTLQLPELVIYE